MTDPKIEHDFVRAPANLNDLKCGCGKDSWAESGQCVYCEIGYLLRFIEQLKEKIIFLETSNIYLKDCLHDALASNNKIPSASL